MSAHRMTLLYCDAKNCEADVMYAYGMDSDEALKTAAQQREKYSIDGWLFKKGKDYCPDCAKALFKIKEQA